MEITSLLNFPLIELFLVIVLHAWSSAIESYFKAKLKLRIYTSAALLQSGFPT